MSVIMPRAEPIASPGLPAYPQSFPPLESGDRMSRDEFHRRYEAMPDLKKAELVEGVVYVPSPIRYRYHGVQHGDLLTWLGYYKARTPGVASASNTSILLDELNEPQPDGVLFIKPECGGQVKIDSEGYIVGAPDLAGEVAASSVSYDLHDKLIAYLRNGVREYVVWRVFDAQIDWFFANEGRYEQIAPAADGIRRSTVFPGLWLDSAAMLRGDLAAVLDVVRQGLDSAEHAAFVNQLARN